jgi:hypothetical protein
VTRPGIVLTSAIAWVGVVVGHLVAYLLTYPSQGVRHVHLEITGHEWLGLATASLLAAIPVLLLVAVTRSFRSSESWTGPTLAVRLVGIQVSAFLLIEVVERGWSVQQAMLDPAVFAGLAMQPLLAVIAARFLELVHRAVRAVIARLRPAWRTGTPSFRRPSLRRSAFRPWMLLPGRRRAPPSPLFA